MPDDDRSTRESRVKDRARWPIKKYRLGEEPDDEAWAAMTPEERVRSMWPLAVDAWILSGRSIPDYDRANTPTRLFRPGEPVPADEP